MKVQLWLGFLGILTLLVGCSGTSSDNQMQSSSNDQPNAETPEPQNFSTPLVTQSRKAGSVPTVPGLLQPTNSKVRASTIVTGRRDPFAITPGSVVPIVVSSRPAGSPPNTISPLPNTSGRPLPTPINNLPPIVLPPLNSGASGSASLPNLSGSAPLPPVNVPAAPIPVKPPSRTALAESVEVSGVVQVGNRWNVIVRESSATSSRYVAVGDYLENGKVLVKKIVGGGSTDPVVILQQGGVEIRKSVV